MHLSKIHTPQYDLPNQSQLGPVNSLTLSLTSLPFSFHLAAMQCFFELNIVVAEEFAVYIFNLRKSHFKDYTTYIVQKAHHSTLSFTPLLTFMLLLLYIFPIDM